MATATATATVKRAIEVLPTPAALTVAAAERFVASAAAAIQATGRFVVALSGGSTPKMLFALLASATYAGRVDWACVHVFWGDERCVPPDDPSSNYRMAKEALLDHVPIPPAQVHRMRGEDEPLAAAAAYQWDLRATLADAGGRFDLVLLGMGDNGHTASLFPGLLAVRETERQVVAEHVPEVGMWRLTLTPVAINDAAEVLFLVSGAGKAAMLQQVLEGPYHPEALPAQVVAPRDGRLVWMVDAAAAARLRGQGAAS
jgi:6-phosphogluconolactonase